ncbi:MAG: HEAT repeat domain-containing protein [Anaerolineae bacterium]
MVGFFEPINFGLGAASGVLTTLAVQRIARVVRERNANRERAVVRTYASREADEGYLQSLVAHARQAHLLGHKVRLNDVLVPPRFIPPPDLVELPEEDEPIENVFAEVPRVHEYPYLHAPYHIPTLSIADLSRGARRLILVGDQGSGRTTALHAIALWSAGYLEFMPEQDVIRQQLEDNLDPKRDVSIPEQILRIRRRVARGRQAERQGDVSRPIDPTETTDEVQTEASSHFRDRAPFYVHLADVILTSGEYGREIDPSEPLIRALQRQSGWLTSKRLVNKSYKLLENGFALVLIDGYDDIPADNRTRALRWVRALMDLYPDNAYIIAMPTEGYGLLMEDKAVPVFMRPWHQQDMNKSVDRIYEQWGTLSKREISFSRDEYETLDDYLNVLKREGWQQNPFDNTLRVWSELTEQASQEQVYGSRVRAYLNELLPEAESIMPELQRMATIQLDQGYITLNNLIDYALQKHEAGENPRLTRTMTMMAVASYTDEQSAVEPDLPDYSEFFNSTEPDTLPVNETPTTEDSDAVSAKEQEKIRNEITKEQQKLLSQLIKQGMLFAYRGGRYQFRHKIIASYLAACDLADVREDIIYRKYLKPDWAYAMCYLAEMRDLDFLVAEQLDQPLDVGLENVLQLTHWLKFAGSGAMWRTNLLRYLGNQFAATNQFSIVRERIAAALVGARDDGVRVVFRKGLQTPNVNVRRIASLALGALRDQAATEALSQIVMQDPYLENKIAGVMSLVAIGSEQALINALELMEITNHEEVRRAVTESLAADHDIGYLTLYDMLESDQIPMRRAALFGLGRIEVDWAWVLVDRVFQTDSESFVRLASDVVLAKLHDRNFSILRPYPTLTEMPLYVEWEQEQREEGFIAPEAEPEDALNYAFTQTHDPLLRWLLTVSIGQFGHYHMLDKVYQALNDSDSIVRDGAYRALVDFQEKLGTLITAPVPGLVVAE